MGWIGFSFGRSGQDPNRRSYHSRGGFARAQAGHGDDDPMSVQDVVRNQTFWGQYRGQATAFYLLGVLGVLVLMTMVITGESFDPGIGFYAVSTVTLLLFLAPLGLWAQYKQQRRLYEQIAQQDAPHEHQDD